MILGGWQGALTPHGDACDWAVPFLRHGVLYTLERLIFFLFPWVCTDRVGEGRVLSFAFLHPESVVPFRAVVCAIGRWNSIVLFAADDGVGLLGICVGLGGGDGWVGTRSVVFFLLPLFLHQVSSSIPDLGFELSIVEARQQVRAFLAKHVQGMFERHAVSKAAIDECGGAVRQGRHLSQLTRHVVIFVLSFHVRHQRTVFGTVHFHPKRASQDVSMATTQHEQPFSCAVSRMFHDVVGQHLGAGCVALRIVLDAPSAHHMFFLFGKAAFRRLVGRVHFRQVPFADFFRRRRCAIWRDGGQPRLQLVARGSPGARLFRQGVLQGSHGRGEVRQLPRHVFHVRHVREHAPRSARERLVSWNGTAMDVSTRPGKERGRVMPCEAGGRDERDAFRRRGSARGCERRARSTSTGWPRRRARHAPYPWFCFSVHTPSNVRLCRTGETWREAAVRFDGATGDLDERGRRVPRDEPRGTRDVLQTWTAVACSTTTTPSSTRWWWETKERAEWDVSEEGASNITVQATTKGQVSSHAR